MNALRVLGAYVDLKEVKKSKNLSSNTTSTQSTTSIPLNSDVVFKTILERMNENIEKAKSVNGVFLYNITKDGQIAKKWSKFWVSASQLSSVWKNVISFFSHFSH